MSKFYEATSGLKNIQGQPMYQKIISYKLKTSRDLREFQDDLAEGVNILMNLKLENEHYVVVSRLEPSKIAPATPKLLKK